MPEFNPRYADAEGAPLGKFRYLHTGIYGNREFVEHPRNRGYPLKNELIYIVISYDYSLYMAI